MFINNFFRTAGIEATAARNLRVLNMYVDHSMFTELRMQLATLQQLEQANISEMTPEAYREKFNLPKTIVNNVEVVIRPEAKCECKPAEDGHKDVKTAPNQEVRRGRDKKADEKDDAIRVQIVKNPNDKEAKKLRVPTTSEVVRASRLWNAILLACKVKHLDSYGSLQEHVHNRMMGILEYSLVDHGDRYVLTQLADIMARANAMS